MLGSTGVDQLFACPFCRELYTRGEVDICPQCDLVIQPLAELPPSHEAQMLTAAEEGPIIAHSPEDEKVSWAYLGRARGPLMMVALLGVAAFFSPWLHERSPEIRDLSGFEFARVLGWLWAAGVAWFVMIPLVVTRLTIRQMRGARVAVGFLASMVLLTVLTRISIQPTPHPMVAIRYSWGWGMYLSGFLGALALGLAFRFGGTLEDMPSEQGRPTDETLH
jgi:hypothetical protein